MLMSLVVASFGAAVLAARSATTSQSSYDYIIVGGGTAGAALATRLSQGLRKDRILLIEAGPTAPDELGINVPGMLGSTQGGPYDWNLTTIPQPGLNGRQIALSRGKVLGGSSAMNYMVWNRASAAEYNAWEQVGNPGWNWDNFLRAMEASENFTGLNTADYGNLGRGTEGPINNVVPRFRPEQVQAWVPTMEQLGLVHNLESEAGDNLGVMLQPSSVNPDTYVRSYSANSYLPRAGPNLEVRVSTRVARVTFDRSNKTGKSDLVATGIVLEDGTSIAANKEVILSAGSLQSPGLLELSGIGQKAILDAAGIEQILELPGVGENLQDHTGILVSHQLKPGYHSLDIFRYNTTYAAEQLDLWKTGQFSRYDDTFYSIAFLNWKQLVDNDTVIAALANEAIGNSSNVIDQTKLAFVTDDRVPQTEFVLGDGSIGPDYPAVGDPLYGADFVTIVGIAMRPLARGSVHINSSDIDQPPVIDPKYLGNDYDLQYLIESAKYIRKIFRTQPFADLVVPTEHKPGPEVVDEEAWAAYARESMLTIYHYSGTCAMLPLDEGGVVDPQLVVWGTENLRVVDNSVIPVLQGSHTQTTAYGIAETAAELILSGL